MIFCDKAVGHLTQVFLKCRGIALAIFVVAVIWHGGGIKSCVKNQPATRALCQAETPPV